MLRMAAESRMQDARHAPFDELADRERVFGLPPRAQIERFEALHDDPGVERRQVGPGVALERQQDVVDELFAGAHGAGEDAALPLHQLGR